MRRFRSINPHNNSIIGQVEITTEEQVRQKVSEARFALAMWSEIGLGGRLIAIRRFIEAFSLRAEEFTVLSSKEMGMPLVHSRGDVETAISYLNWYVNNAEKHLASEMVFENSKEIHTVSYEPYGVALAMCSWTLPATNFVWSCVQNLIVGNTVIFKHSEEVPLCDKLIDQIFKESGIPAGVFTQIYGKATMVPFLARQEIDLIFFLGNTEIGKNLYRIASQNMKKIILRLGGSAPGIVFEDADLNIATEHIYNAGFNNAGQAMDSLKRLFVHENIWDPMLEKIVDKLRTIQIGNPLDAQFSFGPLTSKRQIELLERQVADAIEKGATIMFGGKQPGLQGFYFEPTILLNVSSNMRVWNEEVFGPVVSIVKFSTENEAIAMANDSNFGSGAYLFSKDKKIIDRVSKKIKSGSVSVNGVNYMRPENPIDSHKLSGLGKQNSRWGYQEITRIQVLARPKTEF